MRLFKSSKIVSFPRGGKKGFTIFEVLIVVGITIMISTLAISYRSSSQQQIGLYVEVQKLSELILRAKSLSVSTYSDPQAAMTPGKFVCGYGVSIDYTRNGYDLFSYKVPVTQGCGGIVKIENNPPNEITALSSHDVAPGVVVLQTGVKNIYKVLFVPPAPETLISINPAGAINPTDGKIYLTTKDGSLNATISVSEIGQVDF